MTPLVRLVAVLAVALGTAVLPGAAPASAATPTAGQSTYTPVAPVRLLDTLERRRPAGAMEEIALQVAGAHGVPASASAVVLSVTAVGASATTDVQVYPSPTPQGSSNLVVLKGGSASNLVVVKTGEGGRVVLRNTAGTLRLIADLAGYYAEGAGSAFVPVAPERLLDTRDTRSPLGDAEVRTLRVAGVGRVPAEATAVAVNLTAVDATRTTDVRAYPAGPTVPEVSNSNPGIGRPTSVAAVVGIGQDGAIALRNTAGRVDVIVDLAGWFVPSTSPGAASVFHPLPPRRLLDTRPGDADAVTTPVSADSPFDLLVAGPGSVPAQATGVVLTVTALGASTGSDVRVYPVPADGRSVPGTSNLNVRPGSLVANTVHVAVGRDGSVRIKNLAGTVHVIVDLAGWYGPTGRGWDISHPQCTTRGATTATTPVGGAFAVVGLNRGTPFTDNECFAAEWSWASSLPGEPAVYVNIDAAGATAPQWTTPGPKPCSGATTDAGCAFNYGYALARYDAARLPTTPSGGRPFVWFDVEGGKAWQTGAGAVAVNRNALDGAAAGLRAAGLAGRYGIYTDAELPFSRNDWVQIMGERTLPELPLWVFASSNTGTRELCVPASASITRGPVQLVQLRPSQSGEAFDVDDAC
ncbi:MAG: N-acetylmuramoyl-L-alanine amidase [Frankiales bacterium]|nr:N-acetylmuramoyl-L-alanine amidase [Frankiales bacterium]